jgi:hypothetical protein
MFSSTSRGAAAECSPGNGVPARAFRVECLCERSGRNPEITPPKDPKSALAGDRTSPLSRIQVESLTHPLPRTVLTSCCKSSLYPVATVPGSVPSTNPTTIHASLPRHNTPHYGIMHRDAWDHFS